MVDDMIAPLTGYVPEVDGTLENRPIVVLDVETTGLSPRIHEVIELGAVKIENGTIVDRFHSMLKPTRKISQATQDITGIRIDEVLHAPDSETVFRDFLLSLRALSWPPTMPDLIWALCHRLFTAFFPKMRGDSRLLIRSRWRESDCRR